MFSNTLVTTEDLAAHLDDPNWVILDCRFTLTDPEAGREAYWKAHIPGARYAHLDDDLSAPISDTTGRHPLPDPHVLTEKLCDWGVGVNKQVVVYDDSYGAMAGRLWWMMRWLGHPGVALLDGGYPKWLREKRPVDCRPADAAQGRLRLPARTHPDRRRRTKSCTHRERASNSSSMRVRTDVSAANSSRSTRSPDTYRARSTISSTKTSTWTAPSCRPRRCARTTRRLLKGKPAWQVIHMCGSGVTACHNILAMEIAGLPGSRLYPGSWSEWITDPARPVATGE